MRNAKDLLTAYKAGTCTEEEKELVEKWFLLHSAGSSSGLSEKDFTHAEAAMWKAITVQKDQPVKVLQGYFWKRIAVAAAILIVFATGGYHLIWNVQKPEQELVNDVAPGGNKAVLTLANGKKISLTDVKQGEIAQQEGMKVIKALDGRVVYQSVNRQDKQLNTIYNVISTPRGGKFEVFLPDGTKVWLNAATRITFPTSFEGLKERKIKLEGEAYFEVRPDKAVPFKIDMGKQEIEVLGTHFNANNYPDEPSVRTTLLEGSVRISSLGSGAEIVLKPGEQAQLTAGKLRVKEVDAASYIEWKNGVFGFRDAEIGDAMRQLARWYDVEVEYRNRMPEGHITGYISRDIPISKTFAMMKEISDINFSLNGRKVVVSSK